MKARAKLQRIKHIFSITSSPATMSSTEPINPIELASLFEDELIYQLPDTTHTDTMTAVDKLNGKNTVIVYAGELGNHEGLVTNIIAAVNKDATANAAVLSLNDIPPPQMATLLQAPGLQYVWFFGVTPADASVQLKVAKYEVFNFLKLRVLFADPLDKVQQNKRQLWEALKLMYGIV